MTEFKDRFGGIHDLDNPDTYEHLPNTIKELDDLMFTRIGYALVYMDYFHLDIFPHAYFSGEDNHGYEQRLRVKNLIEKFAKHRRSNWQNLRWFQKQVFLFEWETENMC